MEDLPNGWCSEKEFNWLAAEAQDKELVVEIGAHEGRSTMALLAAKKVHSLDLWKHHEGAEERFLANLEQYISAGVCTPLKMNLYNIYDPNRIELIRRFAGSADLVYVE